MPKNSAVILLTSILAQRAQAVLRAFTAVIKAPCMKRCEE